MLFGRVEKEDKQKKIRLWEQAVEMMICALSFCSKSLLTPLILLLKYAVVGDIPSCASDMKLSLPVLFANRARVVL